MNRKQRQLKMVAYLLAIGCGIAVAVDFGAWIVAFMLLIVSATLLNSRYAGLLIVIWVGVFILFADRTVIQVPGFGSGLVPTLSLATIAMAFLMVILKPGAASGVWKRAGSMLVPIAFVAVGAILPILGVIAGYPVRTLMGVVPWLTMLAFAFLGGVSARLSSEFWRDAPLVMTVVAWIEFLAGLIQGANSIGVFAGPLATALRRWDYAVADRYGVLAVTSRSVGFFVNPNVLSALGGFLFVWSLYQEDLSPLKRTALMIPSLGMVFLGASRGIVLGVAASIVFEQLRRMLAEHRPTLQTVGRILGTVLLALVFYWGITSVAPGLVDRFTGRLASGAHVVSRGALADTSASGRIEYWVASAKLFAGRPLGTFGPPEMTLGSSIDSDYVRIVLQGGIVFIGLYFATLYSMYSRTGGLHNGGVIRGTVVVLGVAALTQTTITYAPTMVCVWFIYGAMLLGRHHGVAHITAAGDLV